MHKYKNVSDKQQSVIGVGVVEAGEELVSEHAIENPNLEYIGEAPADLTQDSEDQTNNEQTEENQ